MISLTLYNLENATTLATCTWPTVPAIGTTFVFNNEHWYVADVIHHVIQLGQSLIPEIRVVLLPERPSKYVLAFTWESSNVPSHIAGINLPTDDLPRAGEIIVIEELATSDNGSGSGEEMNQNNLAFFSPADFLLSDEREGETTTIHYIQVITVEHNCYIQNSRDEILIEYEQPTIYARYITDMSHIHRPETRRFEPTTAIRN